MVMVRFVLRGLTGRRIVCFSRGWWMNEGMHGWMELECGEKRTREKKIKREEFDMLR